MFKQFFCIFLSLIIIIPNIIISNAQNIPNIVSDTAVLMDAKTGQILFEKNMDKQKEPASITKILTLYLSTINTSPDDKITVTDAVKLSDPMATHIALIKGEEVTLQDMQYAAMLMSANDACNVIANHIGGSVEAFVDQMNNFISRIGAKNSHFSNPHGLPDPNHYSTAKDMALITREALKSDKFTKIFSTVGYTMPSNNLKPERPFSCQDAMLKKNDPFYYEGIVGGKLGWTEEAKHTKVTVATKNDRTLIAVVMDSYNKSDKYIDTKALLDYGFDQFILQSVYPAQVPSQKVQVLNGVNPVGELNIFLDKPFALLLHKSVDPKDITYNIPTIASVDKESINSQVFQAEVVLPENASQYMYTQPTIIKLNSIFTPIMTKVEEIPVNKQIAWVAVEFSKVFGVVFVVVLSILLVLSIFLLTRKYLIIYKRKKHKRELAIKRKKLMSQMRVYPGGADNRHNNPNQFKTPAPHNVNNHIKNNSNKAKNNISSPQTHPSRNNQNRKNVINNTNNISKRNIPRNK